MEGLRDVLPSRLIAHFDEHRLELLIGGMTEIAWTIGRDSRIIKGTKKLTGSFEWFWACLRSWPVERKARLLQFTMSTSHVPVNGFAAV